jgi:hypothetical protein
VAVLPLDQVVLEHHVGQLVQDDLLAVQPRGGLGVQDQLDVRQREPQPGDLVTTEVRHRPDHDLLAAVLLDEGGQRLERQARGRVERREGSRGLLP